MLLGVAMYLQTAKCVIVNSVICESVPWILSHDRLLLLMVILARVFSYFWSLAVNQLLLTPPIASFWLLNLSSCLVFRLSNSSISVERCLPLDIEKVILVWDSVSRVTHLVHPDCVNLWYQDILRYIKACSKWHWSLSEARHGWLILVWGSGSQHLILVKSIGVLILNLKELVLRILAILVSLAWNFVNLVQGWAMSNVVIVLRI
jgi:hypothetical protein